MKKLMMAAIACAALAASAQDRNEMKIWPIGKAPLKGEAKVERTLQSNDGIVRITDVSDPSITPFPVKGASAPVPAVLVCPGGGYAILAWNHEGTEIAQWLNSQGIAAFVLKYRVPNQRDAALCDAQRAMSLIRANAVQWNVNPKKLGIMGFSAGAHLSVRTSTNLDKRFYDAVDPADAQPCRPDFALIVYPAYLFRKGSLEMSQELSVTKEVCPTFLIQAEDDRPYVDSSLAYFIALKAAGVSAELHVFPNGGHGYGLRKHGKATDAWGDIAKAWLKRTALN